MNKKECEKLTRLECGAVLREGEKTFISAPACSFSTKRKVDEFFFMSKPSEKYKDCFVQISCYGVDSKTSIAKIYDNTGNLLIKKIELKELVDCVVYFLVN